MELREKELRALVSKWEEESMNNLHYAYKISWYIVKQRAEFAYNEYGISWKFDSNSHYNQIFFIEVSQHLLPFCIVHNYFVSCVNADATGIRNILAVKDQDTT